MQILFINYQEMDPLKDKPGNFCLKELYINNKDINGEV